MKRFVLLLLVCASSIVQAQTAPANAAANPPGVITGRVQDENGQPLPGVSVVAEAPETRAKVARTATTNEDGNFRLPGLAASAFALRASLPAYVMLPLTGSLGEPRYFHDGDNVTITLVKGGVITGRVISANGNPLSGLSIKAICLRDAAGKTARNTLFKRRTDDRGIYRIFGLPSGTYIIGTDGADTGWSWNDDEQAEDAPTYHPGSTRDAALEMNLQTGQELTGIDIRYRGERGRTVSGKFFDGGNTGIVTLELRQPGSGVVIAGDWRSINHIRMDQGVGFELPGITDGEYELVAERRSGEDDGAASAPRRLTVSGADVGGIELRLAPFASVAGKLVLENPPENKVADQAACKNNRSAVFEETALSLLPETPQPRIIAAPTTFPARQGDFKIRYLTAGRYRFSLQLPSEAWYLRALTQPDARTQRALDLAHTGLAIKAGEKLKDVRITIATGAASLQGNVKAAADTKLPAGLQVHLVPAEKEAADEVLRYFETELADNGTFSFQHLAPGQYWLVTRALSADDTARQPVAWNNNERLKLRREAEAANNTLQLQPCQRLKDFALKYAPK